MSALLVLRAAFVLVLVATVAGKVQTAPSQPVDMRAVVSVVLARQGLPSHRPPGADKSALASVNFEAPGCDGVVRVMPVSLMLWEEQWLQETLSPNMSRRFVYLDGTWLTADRAGMRLEWVKHRVLSIFGLSRYVADPTVLLIEEPAHCRVADAIDWRTMWDKRTLADLAAAR